MTKSFPLISGLMYYIHPRLPRHPTCCFLCLDCSCCLRMTSVVGENGLQMEIVSADKGDRWSSVEGRFHSFLPCLCTVTCLFDSVWTLLLSKHGNMVQYHLPCQNMVFLNHFFGVISCRVVVLLTQGELSFPPLSSFSSARLIAWHLLMLTLLFPHSCSQMSARFSFAMMCCHWAPSPPPSNWPVVVTGKLSTMGNVVYSCSLLISLPALTIHNGTLAVTVTWCCHLVLHTSAQIPQFWQTGTLHCRTSRCLREDRWLD